MNNTAQTPLKTAIRRFVVDTFLFGSDDGVADNASFLANGIIDSTGVMELVAHLEKTYGIKIQDAELVPENLDSVDAIAAFLSVKGVR